MSSDQFLVRPYTLDDAARIATMWNESDDQWPGTFTNGVPMTEARVRDWLASDQPLQGLVVEDRADHAIAAFGTLFDQPDQENTAYVALLNVHPGFQGRSLCRGMLTQMVDHAVDLGYHRITLDTWSANLKAMPLYKKTGFFWIPDTQVYMENYVAGIRQLPVTAYYFDRHDWYTTFKRELKQIEDAECHVAMGDMKVFLYRWEADDDMVEAIIDREGQALTGLETNQFAAYAIVDESTPAQGLTYPVRWQVINKQETPLEIRVKATGEAGIEIDHEAQHNLAAGETWQVNSSVICAVDARRLTDDDKHKPAPRIRTHLTIGEHVLELGTGLRYHAPLEISCEPKIPSLLPGQPQTIHIQIRNRLSTAISGRLNIAQNDGLVVEADSLDFTVEASGYAGLPITVTCLSKSTPLHISASFTHDRQEITTRSERIPLLAVPIGGITADHATTDDIGDKIIIENEFICYHVRTKGGRGAVWDKRLHEERFGGPTEEIGPPFYPRDLPQREYALKLEQGEGWATASASIESKRFTGLTLTRQITMMASPMLQVMYHIENKGEQPAKFQFQYRTSFRDTEAGDYTMPRGDGLITLRCHELSMGDFPEKVAEMAEQWLARTYDGVVSGLIWPDGLQKHELGWGNFSAESEEISLDPGQTVNVGPFYVYNAPGDWSDVRRLWHRLQGQSTKPAPGRVLPQEALRVHLRNQPLITMSDYVQTQLIAETVREKAVNGQILIQPPAGWTAMLPEMNVDGVVKDKSYTSDLTLHTKESKIGTGKGLLHLKTDGFDQSYPFTLVRLGDDTQTVQITESQDGADGSTVMLDNGRCQWVAAPDFHGGLIAWRESGSDINHLFTKYPDEGELSWIKPWFGGLRPILNFDGGPNWPGKLHEETFSTDTVEVPDARGIAWRGVRLAADLQAPELKGLRAEIDYLSVGGSNVLKAIFRLVNQTNAHRQVKAAFYTFLEVDGVYQNAVLQSQHIHRKRTAYTTTVAVDTWGAVVNPDTGRAVVEVAPSAVQKLELADWGVNGGHIYTGESLTAKPNSSAEMVVYLALAESLDEAEHYAALATL